MLPFLEKNKNKMITTLMDGRGSRTEISGDVESKDSPKHDEQLESAMADLLGAFERKSIPELRDAFRKAFECLGSEPSEDYTDSADTEEGS